MTRLQLFLIVDGVIVAGGLLFFVILFLRRGNAGHFKDDLWQHPPKTPEEAEARRKIEEKVDQLLLGHEPEPEPEREAKPRGEPAAARPAARKAEFQLPNFRGQPHEVLGVPATADADLIGRAYKHWIKRYHPDRVHHLGTQYVNQARRRAEQLNSARQALVQRLAQRTK